jgi:hypothetical protein
MKHSPNRLLATIFGIVYLVVGFCGAFAVKDVGFFTVNGHLLFGLFEVNIFHNTAHVLIGAALLLTGLSSIPAARTLNIGIGAFYLLLGVFGLFAVNTAFNFLAINGADNVLHFGSAIILLAVGLGADHRRPLNAIS